MEFKRSAGVFATGFVLSLIGYILGAIFTMVAASAASSYYRSDSAVLPGFLAFACFVLALIGSIMTVMGLYRAMVKIDALPVPAVAAPASVAQPTAPVASPEAPAQS
ncbi:hypothetical protein ACFYLX_03700 [Pseudarthrobacter enclensis]|uniref:hypothetical protein n=1 Tax=Pseudarthrobacter enclensis TaxID=993070 RepID=UPI0036932A61